MHSKLHNWLRSQTTGLDASIDSTLLEHSRTARISRRMIQASAVLNALTPALTLIVVFSVASVSVMAQPAGGSIFGGNDQTLGNGVREMIKWGRNLLFLLGVGGIAWAVVNYMTEKNWTKQAIGGALCFAFGSIASLAFSFSQGSAVNLDTDLGN